MLPCSFVWGHILGTGSFSTVKYAKRIQREVPGSRWREYAVKIVPAELMDDADVSASIEREIRILRQVSYHANVAGLTAMFSFRGARYLVMQFVFSFRHMCPLLRSFDSFVESIIAFRYAAGGDLFSLVSHHRRLDRDTTAFICRSVLDGLHACHKAGIFHGDIKPENILLTAPPFVKINPRHVPTENPIQVRVRS